MIIPYLIGGLIIAEILSGETMIQKLAKKHSWEGDIFENITDVNKKTLVITAGHSEENKNMSNQGVNEHDYCQEIGERIFDYLINSDFTDKYNVVFLNRQKHNDWWNQRLLVNDIIKGNGLDIEIHLNASKSGTGKGLLNAYFAGNEKGKAIATKLSELIHSYCGIAYSYNTRGIVPHNADGFPNLKEMLSGTDNTSVLSEPWFLFNPTEFSLMTTEKGKTALISAYVTALNYAMEIV